MLRCVLLLIRWKPPRSLSVGPAGRHAACPLPAAQEAVTELPCAGPGDETTEGSVSVGPCPPAGAPAGKTVHSAWAAGDSSEKGGWRGAPREASRDSKQSSVTWRSAAVLLAGAAALMFCPRHPVRQVLLAHCTDGAARGGPGFTLQVWTESALDLQAVALGPEPGGSGSQGGV